MRSVSLVRFFVLINGVFGCSGMPHALPAESPECESPSHAIHDIQGLQEASPFVGQTVTLQGVVSGDFQGAERLGGFFLQEPGSRIDDDPRTSEGIFVYEDSDGVDVTPGDVASVTGTVKEYHGLTEISPIARVRVCGHAATIAPVTASLPVRSALDWEAYEGMLITFPQTLYVADTSNVGHYGEVTLSSSPRLRQPTDSVSPGAEAQALQLDNARSTLVLDDGSSLAYPQSLPVLQSVTTLRVGDSTQRLTGVLGYAFGEYVLYPTADSRPLFTTENPRPNPPRRRDQALRLTSFNLDNYFTTLNSGSPVCGPVGGLGCRGANSPSEFVRQRTKIVSAFTSLDPDIAAIIEVENDARTSIQNLVSGLNDLSGNTTYTFIDTGTIGTDAIKVALLYKPAVLSPVGRLAVLDSSTDPQFADTLNRPALAQSFVQRSNGETFTILVNHLKSKGSSCAADPDLGDGQGPCNLTRTSAIRAELAWLATDPTESGDPDYIIVGDFNAYAREDPISALVAGGYTNLLAKFIGPDAYSYVFGGQSGTLDYAFASASLLPQVLDATEWHINSDEPAVLDYNEEHNLDAFYQPGPYRSSDHDPLVVELQLRH